MKIRRLKTSWCWFEAWDELQSDGHSTSLGILLWRNVNTRGKPLFDSHTHTHEPNNMACSMKFNESAEILMGTTIGPLWLLHHKGWVESFVGAFLWKHTRTSHIYHTYYHWSQSKTTFSILLIQYWLLIVIPSRTPKIQVEQTHDNLWASRHGQSWLAPLPELVEPQSLRSYSR